MPSARFWHIGQLALAWLVAGLLFLVVREGLEMGVYEAQIEGQRVAIVSGLWSASFASALTAAFGAVAVAAVVWLTFSWLTGSRERRRRDMMIGEPHRRPLM